MRTRQWCSIVLVCALTMSVSMVASVGAVDRDEVNRCYRQLTELLKSNAHASPKALGEIVRQNPAAAKECLRQAVAKRSQPGQQGQALREFADRLEETLLIASAGPSCDGTVAERLLARVKEPYWKTDEKCFVLENLAKCCPKMAQIYYLLGDVYLEQRRVGMAADAYKKGLALKDDPDSRRLLAKAEEMMAQYRKQEPITEASLRQLFRNDGTMTPCPGLGRKVNMDVRIQRQILFDEWSHRIKDQFASELKAMGDVLKKELSANGGIGLLIEGHTDRRGHLEKNTKLSWDRAESVKRFLAEQGGIDPSRIRTEGCGPTRPYDPRDNDEGWALNRRVEFKKINLSAQ